MTAPQQEPHTPGVQESPNDQTGPNGPRTPSETTSDAPIGGGAQTGAAANAASEASAQGAQSGKPAANAAKAAAKATAKAAKAANKATAKAAKAANKATAKAEAAARTAAKTGAFKAKHQTFAKLFLNRFDRFSLSTKLVACTLIVLIVGTVGISTAIRQLVSSYLLQKTDNQLISQRSLILSNTTMLRGSNSQNSGMGNNYFLQVRYVENGAVRRRADRRVNRFHAETADRRPADRRHVRQAVHHERRAARGREQFRGRRHRNRPEQ